STGVITTHIVRLDQFGPRLRPTSSRRGPYSPSQMTGKSGGTPITPRFLEDNVGAEPHDRECRCFCNAQSCAVRCCYCLVRRRLPQRRERLANDAAAVSSDPDCPVEARDQDIEGDK